MALENPLDYFQHLLDQASEELGVGNVAVVRKLFKVGSFELQETVIPSLRRQQWEEV